MSKTGTSDAVWQCIVMQQLLNRAVLSQLLTRFSSMLSTKQNRAKFIQSAIKLLRVHGFNGLNIAWKNPGDAGCQQDEEKLKFTLLIKVSCSVEATTFMSCTQIKPFTSY